MTRMTTAELRGYQQICGDDGNIMVIACDQRGGIRKLVALQASALAQMSRAQADPAAAAQSEILTTLLGVMED